MTVIDTGAAVDLLLRTGVAAEVHEIVGHSAPVTAPDVLVFETIAVLRRLVLRGDVTQERGAAALEDLDDVQLELFSSMPLRHRAWEMRDNLTAADALFVALAEQLSEPLATKDRALAAAARHHAAIETVELGAET
ncbi:MAG: type II toxin-antitoxin system VapC family toxin [Solirubrobacterales bacterium]